MKLKSIVLAFCFSMSNFAISSVSQDSPSSIANENIRFFHEIVVRLKSNIFRGRAQNFSSFNLDLDTFVHLNKDHLNGTYTFNLASNGNPTINGVPVWPIAGSVETSIEGNFTLEGSEVTFSEKAGIYYFVESEKGYDERIARWDRLNTHPLYRDYLGSRGRLVGVANLDLNELEIQFYELNQDSLELVRAGVLDTSVVRRR